MPRKREAPWSSGERRGPWAWVQIPASPKKLDGKMDT